MIEENVLMFVVPTGYEVESKALDGSRKYKPVVKHATMESKFVKALDSNRRTSAETL